MDEQAPTGGRVAAAALAATLASVTAAAVAMLGPKLLTNPGLAVIAFLLGAPVALLHLLILGLPLYHLLRRRWALTWWRAALAGFAVGSLPLALLMLASESEPPEWIGAALLGSVPGLVAGLAFWLVLRRPEPARRPGSTAGS
jgi:hypothetical protein